MASRLNAELQPVTDQWIEQIRKIVDNADSLEQLRDELTELLPEMSIDDYAEKFALAMKAAALAGRNDLLEEMNGE
ncbi:DUF935 domain-containing protein [Pectobacterium aroidearum]|nr:DUF935 domain-containing protein [Pectobacterium aroidearum]UUE75483.1 DUF935 domain-containing protein [Pectobacterium aroidearum]